jgi:hypothetical protein
MRGSRQVTFTYFSRFGSAGVTRLPLSSGPAHYRHLWLATDNPAYFMVDINKKCWEELIDYFLLIRHGPHSKRRLQHFFVAAGTCLPSYYLATRRRYTDAHTDSPFIRHGLHRKWRVQQFFVAAGTYIPSRCIVAIREITHTERLMGGIYEVRRWDGLRCHDIHTKFHIDSFRHSKVDGGGIHRHTESMVIS